eukprot:4841364-Pyramimonas_sp.AAC.1
MVVSYNTSAHHYPLYRPDFWPTGPAQPVARSDSESSAQTNRPWVIHIFNMSAHYHYPLYRPNL